MQDINKTDELHYKSKRRIVYNFIEDFLAVAFFFFFGHLSLKYSDDKQSIKVSTFKRGGICAYIRESLPVRCLSNAYLQECLIMEISFNNRKRYVVSLYRSPSQAPDEFDSFINNLEKLDIYSRKADFVFWSINDTTTP